MLNTLSTIELMHMVRKRSLRIEGSGKQPPGASQSAAAGPDAAAPEARPVDAAVAEIVAGIGDPAPSISPKYFYDALGSRLFEAITALPEYYPTRTEGALLADCLGEIARRIGPGCSLIELGAGSCEKARSLLEFLAPAQYVAVDISAEYLQDALAALKREYPEIAMLAIGADLSLQLSLPGSVRRDRRLFCYLGSSIGNFAPEAALTLLQQIRALCSDGGALLIGVDLIKSAEVLHAAYNDSLGVTAAFNLNLLNHVNRLIGSDFDVRDWQHRACFDAARSRIEMHLEARRTLFVNWPGGGRAFSKGQRIHTENSYKYRPEDFAALLTRAGFEQIE